MSREDSNPVRVPPGCIHIKQWRVEEAQRRNLSLSQLDYQLKIGRVVLPEIVMVKKSRFVRVAALVDCYSQRNTPAALAAVETLRQLRERIEAGESFDRHDWGGCGCSLEPPTINTNAA